MRLSAELSFPEPQAAGLATRLFAARARTLDLARPLSAEDMVVQAMPDASPAKWHLAHTTWFFETFVLGPFLAGYRKLDETFNFCFNSYYESQGTRQPREARGLLTRPSAERVLEYRAYVDEALEKLMASTPPKPCLDLVELGVNHEEQHQELLLTDILALFAASPLRPAYRAPGKLQPAPPAPAGELRWLEYEGGLRLVGHSGDGFHWDNETPRHQVHLSPFRLADRLVTNAEWLEFMDDGGYGTASLWLADGWRLVRAAGARAPLYWEEGSSGWMEMSLEGLLPVAPAAPVSHLNYYEADAFARWAGKRLPTEFEWEIAAQGIEPKGNTLGTGALRPRPAPAGAAGVPRQMFGDVWEWTASAYLPYPGYRPLPGAVGEYNGKFMVSQHVLRGASCATPDGHSRPTYRNFFYPHQAWQFTGLRLAEDAG